MKNLFELSYQEALDYLLSIKSLEDIDSEEIVSYYVFVEENYNKIHYTYNKFYSKTNFDEELFSQRLYISYLFSRLHLLKDLKKSVLNNKSKLAKLETQLNNKDYDRLKEKYLKAINHANNLYAKKLKDDKLKLIQDIII